MATCYHPSLVPVRRKSVFAGRRLSYMQEVPCGHCLGCRSEQGRQWAVRIMHEMEMHEFAWFLTLTYNDETLPDYGSLDPTHLRKFFKDLRKLYPARQVSFYACGEYGERKQRPHYHAVLFGADFLDRRVHDDPNRSGVWQSEILNNVWGRGLTEFGTVSFGSASYVAGYVRKKVDSRNNPDYYTRVDPDTGELVDLVPEFSRMSLRPAIGRRWIEKYWSDVYPRDYVVFDGARMRPPRYYDKYMDEFHPELMEEVRQKRWEEREDLPREKLAAKKAIHESRNATFRPPGVF